MSQRQPRYENRRLLDLAHNLHECTHCGRYVPEGLEPAHSNQSRHGKGMSMKAHDCFHAALCHACHARLDQGSDLSREMRHALWEAAHENTFLLYLALGWIEFDCPERHADWVREGDWLQFFRNGWLYVSPRNRRRHGNPT